MASMNHDEFISMIENSPIESVLLDYRTADGRLIGTVLTDVQNDGLSAVYSFFDPDESKRSLGTYMIMDMIDFAKELGLAWLYLGYYVEDSSKMYYKARFQPASVFIDGQWQTYEAPKKT
jgi:arginine-tRNA-protein transferase